MNKEMPDSFFEKIIKDICLSSDGESYEFFGDWGNWNWLYNKAIECFLEENRGLLIEIPESEGE